MGQVNVCTFDGAGEANLVDFDSGLQGAKMTAQCALINNEVRRVHQEMGGKTPWLFPEDNVKSVLANREAFRDYADKDNFRLSSAFWLGKVRRMIKRIDIVVSK